MLTFKTLPEVEVEVGGLRSKKHGPTKYYNTKNNSRD